MVSVHLSHGLSDNDPPVIEEGGDNGDFFGFRLPNLSLKRWADTRVVGWGDEVTVAA